MRIGGEHEDSYHSEFCIYNDAWIHEVDGRITFFRYPREDFPPTDFHTATLHRDGIHVIGCLGYRFDRQEGITPVFRLDTVTWRMQRLHCEGDGPGWIHRHRATMIDDGVVLISGGEVYTVKEGRSVLEPVSGRWTLNLVRRTWRRVD